MTGHLNPMTTLGRELQRHGHRRPWHDAGGGEVVAFPWEKLDGRPHIYASMGTLQNRQQFIFETIAAACAGLAAQLVISLGSRESELPRSRPALPGKNSRSRRPGPRRGHRRTSDHDQAPVPRAA